MSIFANLLLSFCLILSGSEAGEFLQSSSETVPNQYVIALKSGTDIRGTTSVLDDLDKLPGLKVLREYKLGRRTFLLISAPQADFDNVLKNRHVDIIGENEFLYTEEPVESYDMTPKPKRVARSVEGPSPNSPQCHLDYGGDDAWGIIRTSHRDLPNYLTEPYLWGDTDSGEGVDAYIVDTGVKITHSDFEGRAHWGITTDYAFEQDGHNDDKNGHGTHIAGTVAGARYGLARKANIFAVKVLPRNGSGPWSDTIQGLEWIINRINQLRSQGKVTRSVLNMSLSSWGTDSLLEMAILETIEAGVVFCNSAGNTANNTCLRTPARMASTISVGATEKNDSIAAFSNYGPCCDILAPGRSITSAGILTNDQYVKKSGTSMSTPHVVGIAARYLSSLSDEVANTTSHYRVKAILTDLSTKGVVDLYDIPRLSSPNHLLYKMCDSATLQETTTTQKYTSRKLPGTQGTTTTTTTTKSTPTEPQNVPTPVADSWSNDQIGEVTLGLIGVMSTLVGATFAIMAFTHINIALRK